MLSPTFNTFFNLFFTISVNGIIIHIVAPVKPWEPSVAFFSHLISQRTFTEFIHSFIEKRIEVSLLSFHSTLFTALSQHLKSCVLIGSNFSHLLDCEPLEGKDH